MSLEIFERMCEFLGTDNPVHKMSMVKVNPKLYGACRLCLEDLGQYVIIPKVQEQIKYCFDIIVEPFDGMPQLLCNNCERILREYFEIKKKFILKQNDLLNSIIDESKKDQHLEDKTVESQDSSTVLHNERRKSLTTVIREELLSTYVNNKNATLLDKDEQSKNEPNTTLPWPSGYRKQFACRLCNYRGGHKKSIFRHIDICHKILRIKYQQFLKKKYEVKIEKLDEKPNLTGVNNTVVIDNDKIIQNVDTSYYIIYTSDRSKKKREQNDDTENACSVRKRKKNSVSLNELVQSEKKKSSNSPSTENNDKETLNGECICIEDSSDSAPEEVIKQSETKYTAIDTKEDAVDLTEQKITIIKDIVTACHKKHMENIILHQKELHTKPQLKHKVLSIGRKIINKQGFNCTGLLRYIEHRNLEILWTPYTAKSISDSNFVRIMTKLRGHREDEDELGWKTLPLNTKVELDSVAEPKLPDIQVQCTKLLNENPVANPKQMPRKSVITTKVNESLIPSATTNNTSEAPNETTETSTPISEPPDNALSMPIIDISENTSSNNKKSDTEAPCDGKKNEVELSAARIKVKPLSELLCNKGLNNLASSEPHSSALLSPGLKTYPQNQQNTIFASMFAPNDIIQTTQIVQPGQLFQVTPVVSGRVIQNQPSQNQPSPILTTHLVLPNVILSPTPAVRQNEIIQENQSVQVSVGTANVNTEKRLPSAVPPTYTEYVIMDTPEFPNVKTHSPINYVRTLLQMHNIILLTKKQEFHEKSTCLIRFKVLYKQETLEDAIILSLSLLCYKNKFCMQVENVNQDKVVLSSISANWQWEIIRVFVGDVANKLLLNAEKVDAETHDYAKTFIRLLKSIKYIRR